jgi:uncharacterized DUF497 family protein
MFEWDADNTDHIAQHRASRQQAEQAFGDPNRRVIGFSDVGGERRGMLIGATRRGRTLTVVFTLRRGRIRVVTAYPANLRQVQRYQGS